MNIEQFVADNLPRLSPDSQREILHLVMDCCRRELPRKTQPGLGIEALLADKRADILAIAAQHGAYNVRVFGSVARGEADQYSDIDFLIDYEAGKTSPWFPVGLIQDLAKLLERKVDVVTEGGLKDGMRDRVLKEARVL
ncbi:nucleotidyltransferase family protein [Leptolyngbya sp. PCC 6406]|uniref:nucleotidyltransferase family protein n=1 Tax=Leptolyngbya sp. PCC 6406 TaxID=1173264 RepID=UPI0002ABC294|nr:nucleotidyltransferase domain-containing protein [Leptolyngbya sp. PCC 6406]